MQEKRIHQIFEASVLLYRYAGTGGPGLLLLTALDIVVVGLTFHEYRLMRRHLPVD